MRFAAINAFIRPTEGAQFGFDLFYPPESQPALTPPGAPADRAVHANLGKRFIE